MQVLGHLDPINARISCLLRNLGVSSHVGSWEEGCMDNVLPHTIAKGETLTLSASIGQFHGHRKRGKARGWIFYSTES